MEIVPSEPWSCKEIIFSDIGRDTAIVWQGNMILDQLDLYHPWKRIVVDFEWLRKLAESNVSFIISGHYMMGPRSADAMLEEVKSLAWASRILNSSSDPDMVDCMIEEFILVRTLLRQKSGYITQRTALPAPYYSYQSLETGPHRRLAPQRYDGR